MTRRALAAAATVALLAGCAGPGLDAGAPPAQTSYGWRTSCTTNSTGKCTVPNLADAPPAAVVVTPRAAVSAAVTAWTATTITVAFVRNGSPLVGGVAFDVHVDLDSATATPTPSATVPTTPPTTTPPPSTDWPDASNTGVPAGTTLTAYTGPCTITAANAVIDAKTIACDMEIQAPGVTITRSRITGAVNTPDSLTTTAGFTLSDSEVTYPTVTAAGRTHVGSVNFVLLRSEVTGGNRGVYCRKNCEVRDSYVHGIKVTSTLHASAVRMSQDATIVHNTLHCDAPDAGEAGCSADLTGYGDFEPVRDNLIERNLFKATPGGACAYGGSSSGKPYSGQAQGIVFRDNVFERGSGGKCGFYFPITDFDPSRPGNVWTGNVWADGGTVPPG